MSDHKKRWLEGHDRLVMCLVIFAIAILPAIVFAFLNGQL
jgi:hypothetical protein